MTTPAHDQQFAKDVARQIGRQIERRRLRRKLAIWGALIALIVLAVTYLTCGRGFGLGGKGKGEGPGPGAGGSALRDAGPTRCLVRVAVNGITVDGKPATRDEAVAACKLAGAAELVITGDARQGDGQAMRAALEAATLPVFEKQGSGAR